MSLWSSPWSPWLWFANPKQPQRLDFRSLSGTFVSDHSSRNPVSVTRVIGSFGFEALIFRTAVHEDLDGAPRSYAPPVSATNHSPRGGLSPLDHINNATNEVPPVFHPLNATDPIKDNSWSWTGVVSMTPAQASSAGREIDERDFLKDRLGRFPVMQRIGTDAEGFYAPQTAIATRGGDAVNPLEVPYAALSALLRDQGQVRLGDFGLAIRAKSGVSSPFIYADAGGVRSTSVGEYSRKLIRNLFGGGATTEKVCFIVFPGSRRTDRVAEPEFMRPTVQLLIKHLGQYYENADDLPMFLANPATNPATLDPTRLPGTAEEQLISRALISWGFKPSLPYVPLHKEIF